MFKGARARERVFEGLMWLVSLVLAGFLIGLGSLVIGDLPKVSQPVELEQFVDPAKRQVLVQAGGAFVRARASLSAEQDRADEALAKSKTDYDSAKETFDNWIRTRSATASRAQDPEVLARTRELDRLNGALRQAQATSTAARTAVEAVDGKITANEAAQSALRTAAEPAFERARFMQELKVFGFRLALTLPLLAISAWMLFRRPRGDYWPMKRGFIVFSAFAFFVELVPYLPEYGGYVRYGVGIVLTFVIGHYVIKGMRAYLKAREADESRAEVERVRSIQYDEALTKMAARSCPGCDRILPSGEAVQLDYCVHCGMHLFNRCANCNARKFAFYRFCMTCGVPAVAETSAAG